jgi:anti-sigma factor RsiW
MSQLSRTRDDGCPSDLAIDRLLRGELDGDRVAALRAHAATCDKCRTRIAEIEAARAAFVAAPPPLRRPAARRRWAARAFAGAGATLAAAAALVLLVPGNDGTRRKGGGQSVAFYVQHGDDVRRGQSGEQVAPGDFLQLVYSAPAPLYGAILSVDGAQRVSRYFPDGPSAGALPAGTSVRFPRSTRLDDVLGHETVYALLCRDAIALDPLLEALAAGRALDAPACHVERIDFEKRRP